jgi:hypothetical protein
MLFRLLVPGAIAMAGCGHAPPATVPDARLEPIGPRVGRDELLRTGRPLLLDALRLVRPNYFASRGPTTLREEGMPPIVVVIEGLVLADIEPLRSIAVSDVAEVRRLSVAETFFRYNRSVSIGGIEVVFSKK